MTRQLISIEVDGTIFAIRGWKAHGLALGAGLRPTYSGVRGAWVADTKRLPELLAYLQHRHIAAEVDDITPGKPVAAVADTQVPVVGDEQLSLFDRGR